MSVECAPSCKSCHIFSGRSVIVDENGDEFMDIFWGEPQRLEPTKKENVLRVIEEMNAYMENEVLVEEKYAPVKDVCRCQKPLCSRWAADGKFFF